MALTKVDICNQALGHLRASPIQSFSEASENAVHCRTWYDTSLKEALAYAYWNFARKRVSLAFHGDDAPSDGSWAYRYQVPADMIRTIKIINPLGDNFPDVPFEEETSEDGSTMSILTDLNNATLRYVFFQQNTALYPPAFVYALGKCLAKNLSMPITEKPELANKQERDFYAAIMQAAATNGNSDVRKAERDADVISARA